MELESQEDGTQDSSETCDIAARVCGSCSGWDPLRDRWVGVPGAWERLGGKLFNPHQQMHRPAALFCAAL